ncbi:Ig-like domain-containing protein [Pseudomonas aeruginosa]
MKNLIDSKIGFAVIAEDAVMQAYILDSSEAGIQQVLMAKPGVLYVLQEPQSTSLEETLIAERSGEDLLLSFHTKEQGHPALTFEQFFANKGRLHVLKQDGGLLRAIMGADNPQQGPTAFALQASSAAEKQMVVPVLDLLREVMFPAAEVTPDSSAAMESVPQANPNPGSVQPAALNIASLYSEPPQITHALDQLGARQGSLTSGNVTDDRYATIEGTGTPGAYLEILDNGEVIGEVRVGSDGRWSFEPDQAYNEAGHILTAREQGSGESSAPFVLVVDTIAPSRAFIDSISDDRAGGQLIERNGHTSDNTPVIKGRAEPFSVVVLYSGKNPMGTAFTDASGNWEFSSLFIMPDGEYTISATALDFSGNAGLSSTSYKFTVDTLPPAPPSIDLLADDVGAVQGALQVGTVTDDTRPTLTGRSESGTVVSIYDNGLKLGEARADESGNWSFTPEAELAEGEHSFTARAQDVAGNQSELSQPWDIVIDITPPEKPDNNGEGPGIGEAVDNHGPIQGPIEQGGVTDDTTPTFNGTGEPGDTIIIRDGEEEIGRVEVGSDGNWSFTPEEPLVDGEHEINVIIQDEAGNQSDPSDPWIVIVDTQAPDAPTIGGVYDDVGAVTGELVSGANTDDTRPTLTGQAEAGSIVSIYDNGSLLGTTFADASGGWSFTPENELDHGSHRFTVEGHDMAGNLSPTSEAFFDLTIGISGASIDDVLDDVGPIQGSISSGQYTDDATPTLSGKGKPSDTVHIYDNGELLGSSQVGEDGKWQFTPSLPLSEGTHSFTVITEDPAGNPSVPSAPYVVIIDLTAPTQSATITSIGKDSGANSDDWLTRDGSAGRLIQGTLSAALAVNEKLQISTDGGLTWVDALVDGSHWSAQDNNSHDQNWKIQARTVDSNGLCGEVSTQEVILDTHSPKPPVSIRKNGDTVTVLFDKNNIEAGDRISLVNGDQRQDYLLTEQDIAAGRVTLTPSLLVSDDLRVGIVDRANNISSYMRNTERFTDFSGFALAAKETKTIGDLTVKSEQGASTQMLENGNEALYTQSILTVDFHNPATEIKFKFSCSIQTTFSVALFGINGQYIGQINTPVAQKGIFQEVTYSAPLGTEFSKIILYPPSGSYSTLRVDDFSYKSSDLLPPNDIQLIVENGGMYGGEGDTTFIMETSNMPDGADVSGAGGMDQLKLIGGGQLLDFSNMNGRVSSVEIFDITGSGNNTLKLSLDDVLENGGQNLFLADDNVQLMVKGDAGDKVVLDDLLPNGTDPGNWEAVGEVSVEGVVYKTYQHSALNAELLVQQGVTVDLV